MNHMYRKEKKRKMQLLHNPLCSSFKTKINTYLSDLFFSPSLALNQSFELLHFTEILAELLRREKQAKIKPDPDIDSYMKVRKKDLTNKC